MIELNEGPNHWFLAPKISWPIYHLPLDQCAIHPFGDYTRSRHTDLNCGEDSPSLIFPRQDNRRNYRVLGRCFEIARIAGAQVTSVVLCKFADRTAVPVSNSSSCGSNFPMPKIILRKNQVDDEDRPLLESGIIEAVSAPPNLPPISSNPMAFKRTRMI